MLIPSLVAAGVAIYAAVNRFLSEPTAVGNESPLFDDFKARICTLHWELFCDSKIHENLYDVLGVEFNADESAIIVAYQKSVVEVSKAAHGEPHENAISDRRLQHLNSAALTLLSKRDKKLYNELIMSGTSMVDSYVSERKMEDAERQLDMKKWKKSSKEMRKV